MKRTISKFTLIEMLVVMAIISILAGILLPGLGRAKMKAKSVRWLAYNAVINRDGDAVLNFNFMYDDYMIRDGASLVPALRNGAVGCTLPNFDPKDYDGIISGSYEWRKGAGRWGTYNNALQFDGVSTLITIPGEKVFDFDVLKNDFSVSAWIYVDNLNVPQTLFSKPGKYELILKKNSIEATIGSVSKIWRGQLIEEGRWNHIAIVWENASAKGYLNGNDLDQQTAASVSKDQPAQIADSFGSSLPIAFIKLDENLLFMFAQGNSGNNNASGNSGNQGGTVTPPSGTTTQGQGNAYGTTGNQGNSGNSNAGGNSGNQGGGNQNQGSTRFHIGASLLPSGGTGFNFNGRMDEFIFVRRAFSSTEVKGQWRMGNPY